MTTHTNIRAGAFKITAIYVVTSLLWIALSDQLLDLLQGTFSTSVLFVLGSIKGFAFVVLTGFMLYELILSHNNSLLKRENQYRLYFEDNPTPMWVYNRETLQFTAVNHAAVAHYGYSADEFKKMSILDIRPEEDKQRVAVAVENLPKGLISSGIWTHRKKNGDLIQVQISSQPITSGGQQSVMTMATDVTELKRIEAERNDYLFKLEDTLNSISDGFFTLDKEWNVCSANAMFEIISGFKRTDIIGKNLLEKWPGIYKSVYYVKFNEVLQNHVTVRFEDYSTMLQKWLQLTCYPTREGAAVYFTDITESKHKDIQLEHAVERYAMASRATQDMLYEYDLLANKLLYSQNYGYFSNVDMSKEADAAAAWLSLVHPDDVEKLADTMNNALAITSDKYECEYRVDCGNKVYRYVYDQASIIYDKDGRPLRMIGSVKDITDIKEKEAALLRQNNILREIAWVESHEVRRPLASMLSLIELIQTSDSDEEKKEFFNLMDISARELDAMVCKVSEKINEVTEGNF